MQRGTMPGKGGGNSCPRFFGGNNDEDDLFDRVNYLDLGSTRSD
jgi:hypothetical protein